MIDHAKRKLRLIGVCVCVCVCVFVCVCVCVCVYVIIHNVLIDHAKRKLRLIGVCVCVCVCVHYCVSLPKPDWCVSEYMPVAYTYTFLTKPLTYTCISLVNTSACLWLRLRRVKKNYMKKPNFVFHIHMYYISKHFCVSLPTSTSCTKCVQNTCSIHVIIRACHIHIHWFTKFVCYTCISHTHVLVHETVYLCNFFFRQ